MSMYEEEKPEEPGAPPPAEGAAVPEYSESTEGMAGGSWWETMSLSVCGKQLSTYQAQKAIYGLGALVVVLIIVVVATAGGTVASACGRPRVARRPATVPHARLGRSSTSTRSSTSSSMAIILTISACLTISFVRLLVNWP